LFRALLHFLVLAAAIAPASAQVYKWVDERGVTHYGERPPQGGKASEVPDKLGSPGGVPPKPPADPAAAPAQPEMTEEARRREQCNQQRELLDRLVQNELGSGKVQMDRADAIVRQEKLVNERCKGL